ncbi:DOMON-like domain-containing protein [Sphingomonas sp. KRR8]|uniref:DOMON-like domain-containing protein n=1 Tax=Sphingomonas sp. KRR8 TaxID=2942996 RepID=UPI0020213317|nr:DOMON-like domain-containing protein [Sphingomonas sp. KRR8]URD61779.1 DOMON-like domain-containing protein [Sphingomonas sp. KRR8]
MHLTLIPHPATPPARRGMALEAWVERWDDGRAEISFHLHAPTDTLVIPDKPRRGRADELWKTTCFELFVQTESGYREYNFSPSGAWAAYDFTAYREGQSKPAIDHAPEIDVEDIGDKLLLDAILDLPAGGRFGLSAVVEEVGGTKSYWALAHGADKPDFHHAACFAATLPPVADE